MTAVSTPNRRISRKRTFILSEDGTGERPKQPAASANNAQKSSPPSQKPKTNKEKKRNSNSKRASKSILPKLESGRMSFKQSVESIKRQTTRSTWDDLSAGVRSASKQNTSKRKSVRELVRREGILNGGGNRLHRKQASGVCQIVQRGSQFIVRLRQVVTSNQHNSSLHVFLTNFTTSAEMSKVERKGVALKVPGSEDGLYHNENEGSAPLDLELPRVTDVDPLKWVGMALVKTKASWPTTDHPVVYAYCNFKDVHQDYSKLEEGIQARRENIRKFEHVKVTKQVWGAGRTFQDIRREIKPMLKYFDKNKSGDIDLVEFQDILENLGLQITEARAVKIFQSCDADKSKSMDIEELPLALYLNSLLKPCTRVSPKDVFDMFDAERSGKLDEVEFFEALRVLGVEKINAEESQGYFEKVDTDRSGFISYPEFLSAWVNVCDLELELKVRGLSIGDVQKELRDERKTKIAQHRAVIRKARARKESHKLWKSVEESTNETRGEAMESSFDITPIKHLIDLNAKEIGFMETVFGVGRRKRKKAILMQAVLEDDTRASVEFEKARKKASEESSQLRQKRDHKKRELRNLRAKEALAARKEKSRADRQARKKKAHEVQESINLRKREEQLRAKMEVEISQRKERQRAAQKAAREWQQRMEKEARARRGEDRMILRHNDLRIIPTNIYLGKQAQEVLSHLVVLNFSGNKIETLPTTGFLFWCSSLRKLDLSNNRLSGELPSEIEALERLQVLNLFGNKLEKLPSSLQGLKELRILNVSENNLQELPDEIGALSKLHTLIAYHNNLKAIPPAVKSLKLLTKLDLALNQLTELPEEVAGLERLTTLNVSWNQLRRFPRAIGKLQALENLELSSNKVRRLPDTLDGLKSLAIFNIRSNELIEIPPSIRGLTSLLELDASYNRVQKIPVSIGSLTSLQSINLAHNEIKEVPAEFGYLSDLVSLDFHDNLLSMLPPEVGALTALQRLDISHNRIQGRIPKQFGALLCLAECILSFNEIEALPSSIGGLLALKFLDLQHNHIKEIPSEIQYMKSLQTLLLNNNRIAALPFTFALAKPLETVDLSSNQLVRLVDGIHEMQSLRSLRLHHNQLEAIPPSFGELIPRLEAFVVTHNPLGQMPPKWCERWGIKEQAELLWSNGYSNSQVADWALEAVAYFGPAAAEFESDPKAYATAATGHHLRDFLSRVETRMGEAFHPRFTRDITHFFFKARKLGCAPRFHQCGPEEASAVGRLQEAHSAFRQRMAAFAKERQEAEEERVARFYRFSKSHLRHVGLRLDDRRRALHRRRVKAEVDRLVEQTRRCMEEQEAVAHAREVLRREKAKREKKAWMDIFQRARREHVREYKATRPTCHLGAPTGGLLQEVQGASVEPEEDSALTAGTELEESTLTVGSSLETGSLGYGSGELLVSGNQLSE